MTYNAFMLDLNKYYYDLWDIGLKKQANLSLKKYLQDFNENTDVETRFSIWYTFCENYCKNEDSAYIRRRSLPYEISLNVMDYLNHFPDTMPQIKWCYIITNDKDVLDKAFNHKDCDQEIVEYKFSDYIDTLYWGAHHASEGIIIIQEELVKETINACLSMIETYNIPMELQNSFHYYVRLYELLNLFKTSTMENFGDFCKNNNFPFNEIGTYYYVK